MRRRGLCGSGLIAEASAAVSRARVSTICWSISTCHVLGFFAGAVLDYSAGFSLPMPDAETSISEEPGARTRHAGICAGAVRATGRPTAMADTSWLTKHLSPKISCLIRTRLLHLLASPHFCRGLPDRGYTMGFPSFLKRALTVGAMEPSQSLPTRPVVQRA